MQSAAKQHITLGLVRMFVIGPVASGFAVPAAMLTRSGVPIYVGAVVALVIFFSGVVEIRRGLALRAKPALPVARVVE